MLTLHPPSLRRQDWGAILVMATLVFMASFIGLLYLTWQWGTDWPSLSQHLPYWRRAALQVLLYRELTSWLAYWQHITQWGLA